MKKVAFIVEAANPAAPTPAPAGRPQQAGLGETALLQLHQKLQASLDMATLANRFFGWLEAQLPVAGLDYVHPDEQITVSSGVTATHQAHYVLRLEQRYLGEITLSARKRMSEQHLALQEQAMGVLVHYVKSALDYKALERVAFHDSLTGVMNRTALDELLPKEVQRAQRHNYDLSVIMIDIDHFKTINDELGHLGGDEVLRQVSDAISKNLRRSDLPFRYGGDEFLLILPGTDIKGAHCAAGQIMKALGEISFEAGEQCIQPELSIGTAAYQPGESHEELLRRADTTLYDAKNTGRNCIR